MQKKKGKKGILRAWGERGRKREAVSDMSSGSLGQLVALRNLLRYRGGEPITRDAKPIMKGIQPRGPLGLEGFWEETIILAVSYDSRGVSSRTYCCCHCLMLVNLWLLNVICSFNNVFTKS